VYEQAMIELAPATVVVQRESLAARVRDELAAAGLPVTAAGMSPHLRPPGAEVRIDKLAHCHAPVRIDWYTNHTLREAFRLMAMAEQVDTPLFAYYQVVVEAMLRTMMEILTAAGFTVRSSTNDFTPLTLEVLDGPSGTPLWYPD
jgi:hypothetical protein